MKASPLYATIPHLTGEWTVTNRPASGTLSSRLQGYGRTLPGDLPSTLPVVRNDLAPIEAVMKGVFLPDTVRPREEADYYTGTLASYLEAVQALGIPVETVATLSPIH